MENGVRSDFFEIRFVDFVRFSWNRIIQELSVWEGLKEKALKDNYLREPGFLFLI